MSPPQFAVLLVGLGIAAVLYLVYSNMEHRRHEYEEHKETRQNYQSNNNARRRSMSNMIVDMGECTICFDTVDASEAFTSCGGKHVFHEECIREWILQGPMGSRFSCPICRRALIS